jgi:PmbA protein
MPSLAELARAAEAALEITRAQPDVREAEVFVAANGTLLTRLNYTSHIPCNGVEEPKSVESYGLGIQVVLDGPDGPRIGFGSEPSDLGAGGAARALAKARASAVHDPEFVSLPKPTGTPRTLTGYHDPAVMSLSDDRLVECGWTIVNGALRTFLNSSRLADLAGSDAGLRKLGLILGGDVSVIQERVAIVSTHLPRVQTDESSLITAYVTAMVEAPGAKGSGWSATTRLADFTDEAGVAAAQAAIDAIGGQRVPSGHYTVVFGPQPVSDILSNLVLRACDADAFYASATPFLGRLGQRVASPVLSIYDDGARAGLVGSKGVTCEGLPTGRTDLITDGVLSGCLSNWYVTQRLLRDPALGDKLGATGATAAAALAPRNGFRFATGGGRDFEAQPGVATTNVIVEGRDPVSREALRQRVGDGLYIGRIWYCYAINGLRAGDFTCTVVADSAIIRGGRIVAPLKPNTIRINDNIRTFLGNVVGVSNERQATIGWGTADEVVYTPEIAVSGVRVDEIAGFIEELS